MNRKEFVKTLSLFGIGATVLPSFLTSCQEEVEFYPDFQVNFSGKVIIVGAGTAGLLSGYILKRYNIDFEIIEASSIYGGRVKADENLSDVPIDIGAEWIHVNPSILARLLNDNTLSDNIEVINYTPETFYVWRDGKLRKRNFVTNFYGEYKFKNTTWFSYLDRYVVPSVRDNILLNSPINDINYSGDKVQLINTANETFEADRVILTVPLTILKNNFINFSPALPTEKVNALDTVDMPDGIKVFIEFSEKFYPDILSIGSLGDFISDSEGEALYYDAMFRKDSSKHVLALFNVGNSAATYTDIATDAELIDFIIKELDEIFDGKASQTYRNHVIQNWSKEPFIQGSYSHYRDFGSRGALRQSIDNKLYFAGETYAPSDDDIATVHGAGESAYDTVRELLERA